MHKINRLLVPSFGIRKIPNAGSFLPEVGDIVSFGAADAVAGWGRKPTAKKARDVAAKRGIPYISLEDGFLRSYGLGVEGACPMSMAVDYSGIYYDATTASDLESMIEAGGFSADLVERARISMDWLKHEKLSKYNKNLLPYAGAPIKRLIVDQTAGDASIIFSGADENAFERMIDDALLSFSAADIAIKLHPDTMKGKKAGYLKDLAAQKGVRLIDKPANPWDLLTVTGEVSTISSQFGFEALMAGKKVHCYGMPFYAGWGLTEDKMECPRRFRRATVHEIFAAAYIEYCRYVDPYTGRASTLENTIGILSDVVRHEKKTAKPFYMTGLSPWKKWFMPKFFPGISFKEEAGRKKIYWASKTRGEENILRAEDGFLRSRGLGALLARPWSVVLDGRGIYYDPQRPSDLEDILQNEDMPEGLLNRAKKLREKMVAAEVSKYNVGTRALPDIEAGGRKVILVPGQVEDDASIMRGTQGIRTNLDLLKTIREKNPGACILYKPHPDVEARRRKGWISEEEAQKYCDSIVRKVGIAAFWPIVDEVHTMTSLTGFEGLLRGKKIITYGNPFYSGWGLTEDQYFISRRSRKRNLDELVAAALVLYPFYFDWKTNGICNIETVIDRLSRKASA
jgi:capsular polysaccharide export protein